MSRLLRRKTVTLRLLSRTHLARYLLMSIRLTILPSVPACMIFSMPCSTILSRRVFCSRTAPTAKSLPCRTPYAHRICLCSRPLRTPASRPHSLRRIRVSSRRSENGSPVPEQMDCRTLRFPDRLKKRGFKASLSACRKSQISILCFVRQHA